MPTTVRRSSAPTRLLFRLACFSVASSCSVDIRWCSDQVSTAATTWSAFVTGSPTCFAVYDGAAAACSPTRSRVLSGAAFTMRSGRHGTTSIGPETSRCSRFIWKGFLGRGADARRTGIHARRPRSSWSGLDCCAALDRVRSGRGARRDAGWIVTVKLSVIVPMLNEEPAIVGTLRAIRAGAPGAEIIVVDGGSLDSSVEVARSHCDFVLQ